ncbi:hypothetical protein [Oceanospirillum sediminis]|uniref:Uncharacterized protein n=1 Tax=Oceanospirillum sediminis TaxID=2760088 RepID=A0A839IMX0_9GAMM|nr:hypothetical protein [Oceanospirillum sediminis]MBB1485849.1 hypothetical protein [Oceanospirillum sediminis]
MMKSISHNQPKQTRSHNRQQRAELICHGAADGGVKASGWLDILGKAAKGALGAVI